MTEKRNKTSLKKWLAIVLFAIAVVLSAVTAGKVAIDYNLADYLGNDTQTKIALDIIEDEFGMTGSIQVMAKNVSPETAEEIFTKIEGVDHVLNVNFDRYDETYYKNGNALFVVIVDGDDYSDTAKQVVADVKSALSSYGETEYGGTAIEKQSLQNAITNEMAYILVISLCLVVAILLITSESWIEPIVLLLSSGAAVLINRGTNLYFGEISYITNSISAILQLALSIDYSIVLLHAYRKEKEKETDNGVAMSKAIRSVVRPVSASSLTTIAGLLALLFMSFRIGFDIGIVLMKGIVISAVTSLTLLPALVLLFDKPMRKLHKKAFAPKGKAFCRLSFRAGKAIVPVAVVLIAVCGFVQTGNTFVFSDTKAGNTAISDVFGNNNTVVVVYGNGENNFENERELAEKLSAYKTKEGTPVLTNYTAYTNTVRESLTPGKTVRKLGISDDDAEMLFTMYHLYRDPSEVEMTFSDFVAFANDLVGTDEDAKEFIDEDTVNTLKTLEVLSGILTEDLTADELYARLSGGVADGIDLFSVKQIYGLYFYDTVAEKTVGFKTMLSFMTAASSDESLNGMFDETTVSQLQSLSSGIARFEEMAEMPTSKEDLQEWFYRNYETAITDEQATQIFAGYFATTGEAVSETIPFLPLMKFLVQSGQISDESAVSTIGGYDVLYRTINGNYDDTQFLPVLSEVTTALSGTSPQISATEEAVQQIYIAYFYRAGRMPEGRMNGKAFAEFALGTDKTNAVIHSRLTDENRDKLSDMLTVNGYISDPEASSYVRLYEKLAELQGKIKSGIDTSELSADKISGVYIKYAIDRENALLSPVLACDLLGFVSDNMDTNLLLCRKMNEDRREKVADARSDISKAENLFCGDRYSRMLLSVDLPNEGEETTEFVNYLSEEVKRIFGEDAYVTGEIVSTYDLEKSFGHDNRFITIFTLVSIFVIVMLVFGSLSLPVILVAIIQGAIFIAMSTQLSGNGIFFMSYIVTTCILMGATIDYGILMSSNYVSYRGAYDKKKALELSVEAAMPTVFTSGLILTVCGFVIHFISSQNSISTVGLLIGIGTICSVVMITVVLPSALYLLDKFVLKLSFRRK